MRSAALLLPRGLRRHPLPIAGYKVATAVRSPWVLSQGARTGLPGTISHAFAGCAGTLCVKGRVISDFYTPEYRVPPQGVARLPLGARPGLAMRACPRAADATTGLPRCARPVPASSRARVAHPVQVDMRQNLVLEVLHKIYGAHRKR